MEDTVGAPVASDWPSPVLPERGLVFSEAKAMQLQLCKPKLLPIKSYALERLEKMEKKVAQEAKERRDTGRAARQAAVGWTSPDLQTHASPPSTSAAASPPPPIPIAPSRGVVKTTLPTSAGTVTVTTPITTAVPSTLTAQQLAEASPLSISGMALREEEAAGADAPMSPPEHTLTNQTASEVSASSASSVGYI